MNKNFVGAEKCREWLKEHLKDREHYATTDASGNLYNYNNCPALMYDGAIASLFGISPSTVSKLRNDMGIPIRDVRAAKMREDFANYMNDFRSTRRPPRATATKKPSNDVTLCRVAFYGFILGTILWFVLIVAVSAISKLID